jgi:fumarate reductase subunit D
MIFKIAAIFLVLIFAVALFLGIFAKENHSLLEIIGIIGVSINALVFLIYIIKKKK